MLGGGEGTHRPVLKNVNDAPAARRPGYSMKSMLARRACAALLRRRCQLVAIWPGALAASSPPGARSAAAADAQLPTSARSEARRRNDREDVKECMVWSIRTVEGRSERGLCFCVVSFLVECNP